jgi:TRAP-type C4-dicarboxylate transport system substrate-binding protein
MKFHEVQKHMVVTEHGAMEDIVLFGTAWWNKLSAEQRAVITAAFDEVRPQVEAMKEAVQNTSLETIKAAKLNVRVADETERKALHDAMAPKARATYAERAGAEGAKVLALYDAERKKLGF